MGLKRFPLHFGVVCLPGLNEALPPPRRRRARKTLRDHEGLWEGRQVLECPPSEVLLLRTDALSTHRSQDAVRDKTIHAQDCRVIEN